MGNRVRIVFTDSNGQDISNIICNKPDWESNVIKDKGDVVKIIQANKMNLKNGRAAYQLKEWEVVRKTGASASAASSNNNNNQSALLSPMKKAKIGGGDDSSATSGNFTKLANLNPYSSVWEIEVTLLKLDPVREFKSGTGKLQNLSVMDDTGTMRMTLWNDDVDKYGPSFKPQTVYRISNCNIKPADKRYNKTGMDYELHSKNGMIVSESNKKAAAISYNFIENLKAITDIEVNSMVDICGIVQNVSQIREVNTNYGPRSVMDFTLVDDSNTSVRCSLWGDTAKTFKGELGDAVELKGAKIGEWNGKQLGTTGDTVITVRTIQDCENSECNTKTTSLLNWAKNTDLSTLTIESLTQTRDGGSGGGSKGMNLKDLSTVETMNLESGPQFIDILATVVLYNRKENTFYVADPETNKKLNEVDGQWTRADGTVCNEPKVRLLVNSIKVADQSGEEWVTAFNDQAEVLLNCKGDELKELLDTQGQEAVDEVFMKAQNSQFFMTLKCREEMYQDTPKKKLTIMRVAEVDYQQYAEYQIKDFEN